MRYTFGCAMTFRTRQMTSFMFSSRGGGDGSCIGIQCIFGAGTFCEDSAICCVVYQLAGILCRIYCVAAGIFYFEANLGKRSLQLELQVNLSCCHFSL